MMVNHLGDEHILRHRWLPNIQVRVFNPFAIEVITVVANLDLFFTSRGLICRMHNKLLSGTTRSRWSVVVTRHQYFPVDPRFAVADEDVFERTCSQALSVI